MPLEARVLTGLALATALAYCATPLAIRVADRFEFYDHPLGYKGHGRPTPYLGGAAVVVAFVVALLIFTGDATRTAPLVGGVALMWVIGTIDDRRQVSPLIRVLVEALLATSLWALGLGWDLGAGPLVDLAVTIFWIVAVVNAFNLFDNMDGAASSMAGVVAAGVAVLGVAHGDSWLAVSAAALSGACLGFLPHNLFRSPARIFLGDGGSMPIGFAAAALVMIGMTGTTGAWQSLAIGLLLVGIPALDTCLVVISRRRRGISLLTGGRDHLTHRAGQRLRDARAVAVTLGSAQALVSGLAVVALEGGPGAIVLAVTLYVAALGVAVTLLDTRLSPEPPRTGGSAAPAPAAPEPARRRLGFELVASVLLVPVGLAAGLSPFASGFYSTGVWVPVGIVAVLVAAGLAIARPRRLTRTAVVALAALAGLAVWSLASALWADSIQQAVVEANRILVYVVVLGALLLLVRGERAARWLLGAISAGALAVAVTVLVRMLSGTGEELFLSGRLNQPLGYINGQASLLLLGLWATMAAVEQRRSIALAGAGAAGAALMASLLLLSQSRGVALAAALSALVAVAVVPGRLRRVWALIAIAAGTAFAVPAGLDVFVAAEGAAPPDGVLRNAAIGALAAAVVSGALWAAISAAAAQSPAIAWGRPLAVAGVAGLLLVATAAGLVNAGRLTDTVQTQYRAFVHLSTGAEGATPATGSRLVSGAGNRYDYWRVAWNAWREKPVQGWGAGNYDGPYFLRRATAEDIRQPHSVQMQTLVELGLVGALLLVILLAAVAAGAWRCVRGASEDPRGRAATAAAVGLLTAWGVHTSVDWIHLLPGPTIGALAAVAILLRPTRPGVPDAAPARPRLVSAAAAAAVLALAGVSLSRQALTEHFQGRAEAALTADPGRALVEADRVLRLDPEAVPAYYVKAAALARFNEPQAARDALEEAARREPRDFVTWALLGDLALRMSDEEGARRDYGRAHALNPRDPTLAAQVAPRTP